MADRGTDHDPTSLDLLRAVVEPVRLAVLGAAITGPVPIDRLASELGVPRKDIAEAVGYLRNSGLLDATGQVDRSALAAVARAIPSVTVEPPDNENGLWTAEEQRILERFFDGNRLVSIPSAYAKRLLVLEKVVQEFEPGVRYAERDVNFMIQLIHADYAAIRRYLVDEGMLDRADGAYWRIGGRYPITVEPETQIHPHVATSDPRIALVPYSMAMVPALVENANNERVSRYLSDVFPFPYTASDAERFIVSSLQEDPPNAYAIVVDDVFVGALGGGEHTAERTGTFEIGWWLGEPHWGNGYASTAVKAYVDMLFTDRSVMRISASVMDPNDASKRVAEKAGLRLEGIERNAYLKRGVRMDAYLYGLDRPTWAATA